jgi:hypothetical protein
MIAILASLLGTISAVDPPVPDISQVLGGRHWFTSSLDEDTRLEFAFCQLNAYGNGALVKSIHRYLTGPDGVEASSFVRQLDVGVLSRLRFDILGRPGEFGNGGTLLDRAWSTRSGNLRLAPPTRGWQSSLTYDGEREFEAGISSGRKPRQVGLRESR